MAQIRTASAHWEGDLPTGNGTVTSATGTFGPLATTWRARAEASDTGLTSPEELLAAAWASCFSMASSNELAKAGFTVISAVLKLRATVPGVDEATFQTAVGKAKDGCPISRALKGNVAVTL